MGISVLFEGDMLDLLKWRTHPDKIPGCLSKLKEIDGSEIVKVHGVPVPLGASGWGPVAGPCPSEPSGWGWSEGKDSRHLMVGFLLLSLTVSARHPGHLVRDFR